MARKEHRSTPKIIGTTVYSEQEGFTITGPHWPAWLAEHTTFYYESPVGSFTARRELRKGGAFWYAYRRQAGRLHKCYLGRPGDLTPARLQVVALLLADRAGV